MLRVLILALLLVGLSGCAASGGRTPYRAERDGYGRAPTDLLVCDGSLVLL